MNRQWRGPWFVLIVGLLLATRRVAQPLVTVSRGHVVAPGSTFSGEVVFSGDTISCVDNDCHAPAGARLLDTHGAYIYPGFIDAHNHVAYNVLPKFTPPTVYTNRAQWQSPAAIRCSSSRTIG